MGLIGGLGGGVDRRSGEDWAAWVGGMDQWLGAWAGDVEASGGAWTGRWGLGRSAMGLGVGRRSRLAEQVGGEGAGRRAKG